MSGTKQYPTRMHEVLGVEPEERFSVYCGGLENKNFYVHKNGDVLQDGVHMPDHRLAVFLVNHPERIIRRPRLTEEQVERLKAWLVVGFRWMAKDKEEVDICVYLNKPKKYEEAGIWGEGGKFGYVIGPEKELVSWSDPEPLDIVATLKANRVEVE